MSSIRVPLVVVGASTAASAVVVVLGLVFGEQWRTTDHVVSSAIVIGAASLMALIAMSAWDHPVARPYARGCLVTSQLALFGMLWLIWKHTGDTEVRAVMTLVTAALGLGHLAVVTRGKLAPRHAWVRRAVVGCDALVLLLLFAVFWSDHASNALQDIAAIVLVVASGLTIAIAAVHHLGRAVAPGNPQAAVVCFCPSCGKQLWYPAGEIRCHHCDRAFLVEPRERVEPPLAVARPRG